MTRVLHLGAPRGCSTAVLHDGAPRRCCTTVRHEGTVRRFVGIALAFVLATAPAATRAGAQELPAGTGREIVESRCLVCHEADIIGGQRLTAAGWGREVDKMARWGAKVAAAEREPLVAYLAGAFPVTPVASHGSAEGGEAAYRTACTTCHDDDMIDGQRLSPAGWAREVDKMVRWGARVADADKAALVNYLVARAAARR